MPSTWRRWRVYIANTMPPLATPCPWNLTRGGGRAGGRGSRCIWNEIPLGLTEISIRAHYIGTYSRSLLSYSRSLLSYSGSLLSCWYIYSGSLLSYCYIDRPNCVGVMPMVGLCVLISSCFLSPSRSFDKLPLSFSNKLSLSLSISLSRAWAQGKTALRA
jgi:hypothetical protein